MATREPFGGAALVTGASSGIGEAFARELARRGSDVVVVARREDRLQALSRELEAQHGVKAWPIALDLLRPDAPQWLTAELERRDIPVGLLVNNAGFGLYGRFLDHPPEEVARMVELNCRVPTELTRRLLPAMISRRRGGLIFVASLAGFQPTPFFATYGSTKAYGVMFAEALAAELSGSGIDVLALCPGYTPTEFQGVAGSAATAHTGQVTTVEQVVTTALDALGGPTLVVPGWRNRLAGVASGMLPRRTVAKFAAKFMAPPTDKNRGASS